MSFRFLHAADIHLDSPLRGLEADPGAPAELIRSATRRALGALVDLALEEDVAFLLIAGDIYDGDWPDYGTGLFFASQMARLGKPVVAIRGNHDAQNQMTKKLRVPPNVHVLDARRPESVPLPELGVVVHGQSFAARAVPENLARGYPRPVAGMLNIGLLHTSGEGSAEHDTYAPCSVAELVAHGYDYWALGHIHARTELCTDPWIVFPGNLQGRHVKETGPKGATLVTVADGRISGTPEHRVLDVFRWAQVTADLTGAETEEHMLDRVQAALGAARAEAGSRELGVRVTLTGETGLHATLTGLPLRDLIANEAAHLSPPPWIEGVKLRTSPPAAALPLHAQGHALGELARTIAALAAEPPAALLGDWPDRLMEKIARDALPDDHPLRHPEQIYARARDLLLARLAEG